VCGLVYMDHPGDAYALALALCDRCAGRALSTSRARFGDAGHFTTDRGLDHRVPCHAAEKPAARNGGGGEGVMGPRMVTMPSYARLLAVGWVRRQGLRVGFLVTGRADLPP